MTTDVKPPEAEPSITLPWWTPGDTNAFFGLGFNILVNVLTLTGLMIGVVAVPADDVLGTVLPALGVALILGNLYYTVLARRLAQRENRTDVTALPYGPSVPHMFIVVFVVMLPIYLGTGDPIKAWEAGLAWAFLIGVIVHDRRLRGPVRPQDHAAGGDARHARRHLDHLHLDAARSPDVGGGLDRSPGAGDHPDRLLHRRTPALQLPDRARRAAGRHGDRLDRRLHVGPRGERRGLQHRRRRARPAARPAAGRACPTSRRCWAPPSRSASTTSPRR